MKTQIIIALRFLAAMTLLTGIIYPFFMTGVAQITFPEKANGSLILKNGKIIGSELIAQKFDSTIYFWSRPSAIGYNPIPSGASNYGPTSKALKKQVEDRRVTFASRNSITDSATIPLEMIFASASGLDPHISPKAALMQVDRVVKARLFNTEKKQQILNMITKLSEGPQFSFFGDDRINVLDLNLELDKLNSK